jgi:hypothetical protein
MARRLEDQLASDLEHAAINITIVREHWEGWGTPLERLESTAALIAQAIETQKKIEKRDARKAAV